MAEGGRPLRPITSKGSLCPLVAKASRLKGVRQTIQRDGSKSNFQLQPGVSFKTLFIPEECPETTLCLLPQPAKHAYLQQ